jgi:hypothetical protein
LSMIRCCGALGCGGLLRSLSAKTSGYSFTNYLCNSLAMSGSMDGFQLCISLLSLSPLSSLSESDVVA